MVLTIFFLFLAYNCNNYSLIIINYFSIYGLEYHSLFHHSSKEEVRSCFLELEISPTVQTGKRGFNQGVHQELEGHSDKTPKVL